MRTCPLPEHKPTFDAQAQKVIPLRRITIPVPDRYQSREDFEGHARVMQIRRMLVDLEFSIRRAHALIQRYESEAGACMERLGSEEVLSKWARMDLEGRREEAKAKVEYQRELIFQWQMEQGMYSAALGPETED